MKLEVLERVRGIASDIFAIEASLIHPASSPDSIESWDSVEHLKFVLALEQEFRVLLRPEDVDEMLSIELATLIIEEALDRARTGAAHG